MFSPKPTKGVVDLEEEKCDPALLAPSAAEAEPSHLKPKPVPLRLQNILPEGNSLEVTDTSYNLQTSELDQLPTPVPISESSPLPSATTGET